MIGLPVESVLRIALRPPHMMEFKQVRGTLRALSGQCSLLAVEDGTEVRYHLEVDPGIAMISDDAARQFLVQFVERMLDRIKLAAERKAPARRVDRAVAAESSSVEVEEDDAEGGTEDTAAAAIPQRRHVRPAPDAAPERVVGEPPASEPGRADAFGQAAAAPSRSRPDVRVARPGRASRPISGPVRGPIPHLRPIDRKMSSVSPEV
jgi:hypothetical protein